MDLTHLLETIAPIAYNALWDMMDAITQADASGKESI